MDPVAIIALASEVFSVLPAAISLGMNVEGLISRMLQITKQTETATQADLDTAYSELLALKAQLDADPLPA